MISRDHAKTAELQSGPVSRVVTLRGGGGPIVGDLWMPAEPRGTVVLLHGGGQTRHSWQQLGSRLSAEGWTTCAYDARGHGESGWIPAGDYSMDGYIGDLKAVAQQVSCTGPVVLVGASLGGLTVLLGHGEDPSFGSRLVLVDITPKPRREGVDRVRNFMESHVDGFDSLDQAAEAVHAYNPNRTSRASPEGLRKNLRQTDDGRWRWHWDPAILRSMGRGEHRQDVPLARSEAAARNVRVPTLLVAGGASDVVRQAEMAAFQELIPTASSAVVSGAGHMVAGDRNDEFSEAIVAFLPGP